MDRCLTLSEVNHVMPSIEFINYSTGVKKELDLSKSSEKDIKDAFKKALDGSDPGFKVIK